MKCLSSPIPEIGMGPKFKNWTSCDLGLWPTDLRPTDLPSSPFHALAPWTICVNCHQHRFTCFQIIMFTISWRTDKQTDRSRTLCLPCQCVPWIKRGKYYENRQLPLSLMHTGIIRTVDTCAALRCRLCTWPRRTFTDGALTVADQTTLCQSADLTCTVVVVRYAAKTWVQAHGLDYCNSVLYDRTDNNTRSQYGQRSQAGTWTWTCRRQHIDAALSTTCRRLQTGFFLHVQYTSQTCSAVYIGSTSPGGWCRWLRSSDTLMCVVAMTRTRLGDRSFAVAGP